MSTPLGSPVNEVVLSIAFPPNQALGGPFLGSALGDLVQRFPKVEQQAPYEMPVEFPPKKGAIGRAVPQAQLFFTSQPPEPRYWLISEDEIGLVQIQTNYLAYNWRRRSEGQSYPGFDNLVSTFKSIRDELSARVDRSDSGGLQPAQAELTYINIISPNDLWTSHAEMKEVLEVNFGEIDTSEQFAVSYSKPISDPSGNFIGRVHVSAQPAIDVATGGPAINLTATARSGSLNADSADPDLHFINLAHDHITRSFRSLTTDRARQRWGIE